MIMKWLEMMIEKRINEVSEDCEEKTNSLYENFITVTRELIEYPEAVKTVSEIENLFVLKTRLVTEVSYRAGFEDGLNIMASIKSNCKAGGTWGQNGDRLHL